MTFNQDEQSLLDLFESGNLKSAKNKSEMMTEAKGAAVSYFAKTERINLRLSKFDLTHIKRIAAQEGLPYQTLITGILHKYAMGYGHSEA